MNNPLREDTYRQQSNLAYYCRTGSLRKIDGVDHDRVINYRRLVYNVIDDTLRSAFPLTLSMLTDDEWDNLVNYFFSTHECRAYSVWKTAYEFYEFVNENEPGLKEKYPWLPGLLFFEWIEIEIFMMEDLEYPHSKKTGDWENSVIAFNPEHKILGFEFPVHLKKPSEINLEDKGNYFVLVFREKDSGRVQFVDLSVYFAWLIETLNENRIPLESALAEAAKIFGADYDTLINNTIPFLEELKIKNFITGFRV